MHRYTHYSIGYTAQAAPNGGTCFCAAYRTIHITYKRRLRNHDHQRDRRGHSLVERCFGYDHGRSGVAKFPCDLNAQVEGWLQRFRLDYATRNVSKKHTKHERLY
jgi:hypothetical protein